MWSSLTAIWWCYLNNNNNNKGKTTKYENWDTYRVALSQIFHAIISHGIYLLPRHGVNFTNILHAAFTYVSFARSFFVLTFELCTLLAQDCSRKSCVKTVDEIEPCSLSLSIFPSVFLLLNSLCFFTFSQSLSLSLKFISLSFFHLNWLSFSFLSLCAWVLCVCVPLSPQICHTSISVYIRGSIRSPLRREREKKIINSLIMDFLWADHILRWPPFQHLFHIGHFYSHTF